MSFKVAFILFFFYSFFVWGQNACSKFKDYDDAQNWVTGLKNIDAESRKTIIFERIECEINTPINKIDFGLVIVIDGWIILTPDDIPRELLEKLKLFPAENFSMANSICEKENYYPEKCNLGTVVINTLESPLLNDNVNFKNVSIKRKRHKIIIKFESGKNLKILLTQTDFSNTANQTEVKKIAIKKGKNKISLPVDHQLKFIEMKYGKFKTLFFK